MGIRIALRRSAGREALRAALAAAWLAGLAGLAAAAAPAAGPGGLNLGGGLGDEMDLYADIITFVQKGGEFSSMVASGDVKMTSKGNMTLYCDYLNYDPDKEKMYAKASAKQRVRITQDKATAECGHAEYDIKTSQYILSDNAKIVQGEFVLTGEKLSFSSGENGVQMINDSSASAQKGKLSPSLAEEAEQNFKKMEETFALKPGQARRIVDGKDLPATVTIDTKNKAGGSSAAGSGPVSGRISAETIEHIPDKSGVKGLELAQ